nr:hypothetical protein [Tanacetum cinerariifolium]
MEYLIVLRDWIHVFLALDRHLLRLGIICSADSQRETASQTMELIKYLMEFNSSPGDLIQLSSLFSDDKRVAEAASIA